VTEPGPADPFRLPLSAIDSLRQFVPERSPDHRVRIRGTAIMQGSNGLYVQDDTGGVLLAAVGAQRIAPGEIVEAVGFPEPGSLTTVLSETILRLRGYGGSPTATPIIAEQARRDGRYDGQLVRMEGTVVDRISNAEGSSVVLQSEARISRRNWRPASEICPGCSRDRSRGSRGSARSRRPRTRRPRFTRRTLSACCCGRPAM